MVVMCRTCANVRFSVSGPVYLCPIPDKGKAVACRWYVREPGSDDE